MQYKEASQQLRAAQDEARRVPGLNQRMEELQEQLNERESVLQGLQVHMHIPCPCFGTPA